MRNMINSTEFCSSTWHPIDPSNMSSSNIFHLLVSFPACPHAATPTTTTHKAGQVYVCIQTYLHLCNNSVCACLHLCLHLCLCVYGHACDPGQSCDSSMSQDWKHQHAESAARRHSPGKQCSQTHTLSAKTHCLKHTSKTKHKIKGWVHTHRAWSSLIRIWSIYSLYSFLSDESIWIELSWHLICTTGHENVSYCLFWETCSRLYNR